MHAKYVSKQLLWPPTETRCTRRLLVRCQPTKRQNSNTKTLLYCRHLPPRFNFHRWNNNECFPLFWTILRRCEGQAWLSWHNSCLTLHTLYKSFSRLFAILGQCCVIPLSGWFDKVAATITNLPMWPWTEDTFQRVAFSFNTSSDNPAETHTTFSPGILCCCALASWIPCSVACGGSFSNTL